MTTTMPTTSETTKLNFDGCVLHDDGHACTTPRARDDGKRNPNAETDGGYFILFRFVSFRRKIGGPTRRSAKGGWTPEEVRGLKFENLNAYISHG